MCPAPNSSPVAFLVIRCAATLQSQRVRGFHSASRLVAPIGRRSASGCVLEFRRPGRIVCRRIVGDMECVVRGWLNMSIPQIGSSRWRMETHFTTCYSEVILMAFIASRPDVSILLHKFTILQVISKQFFSTSPQGGIPISPFACFYNTNFFHL